MPTLLRLSPAAGLLLAVRALSAQAPGTDILLAPLEWTTTGPRAGSAVNITARPGYDNQPAFTPDGRTLLFTTARAGQTEIAAHDVAARTTRLLTRTAESEYSPTPVPGGSGIAVVRVERDSTQRVWEVFPDGSPDVLLFPGIAPVGYQAWLDSDHAALFVLGAPPTLRLADLATGAARTVADSIGRTLLARPALGVLLYARLAAQGPPLLMELDVTTGRARPRGHLAASDFFAEHGGWVFAGMGRTVVARPLEGGDWREVLDLGDAAAEVTRLAVSPDGSRLAVVVADGPT